MHLGDSEDFGTDLTILVRILRFWKGSNGFGSIWSWAFPPKPDAPTTTTDDRHHAPTTNQPWQWQSGNDNGDVLIDFSSTTYCSPKYIMTMAAMNSHHSKLVQRRISSPADADRAFANVTFNSQEGELSVATSTWMLR